MAKTSAPSHIKLTLRLPEELYDAYGARALKRGREPEHEIAAHLAATKDYNGSQPIYLTDDDRNTLSVLAGRTIRTPQDLISWAHSISSIKVAGTEVELSETLLIRLRSRAFGKPMPEHIRKTVTECLEEFVGMR